jgi:hypothetical protein
LHQATHIKADSFRTLYRHDPQAAVDMAEAEWAEDSSHGNGQFVEFPDFLDSIFELVDTW